VLTVLAVLLSWDIPLAKAMRALELCRAASGRMEMFGGRGLTPLAIVDYAHTPDALTKALGAARLHCRGQLRIVFGCGGDRDAGKRPLMGRIAAELADDIILTDDNPRTEDPARIVADILAGVAADASGVRGADVTDGVRSAGRVVGSGAAPVVVEHDRALAIRMALQLSGPDDVVLIAGKGHEDYQIYGKQRRPFVDQAIVTTTLEGRRV
jgi:UDP-N-acetylmuramoyl-L-alanyl-D-glutamate--2,6-diaminopimelate ligase